VLDPRTGHPAPGARTACVVAADGLTAGAVATALVAGGASRQNLSLPQLTSPLTPPPRAQAAAALAESGAQRWTLTGAGAHVFETRDPETP
jgi:hypothetical protein